jgi:hypothetical protein
MSILLWWTLSSRFKQPYNCVCFSDVYRLECQYCYDERFHLDLNNHTIVCVLVMFTALFTKDNSILFHFQFYFKFTPHNNCRKLEKHTTNFRFNLHLCYKFYLNSICFVKFKLKNKTQIVYHYLRTTSKFFFMKLN